MIDSASNACQGNGLPRLNKHGYNRCLTSAGVKANLKLDSVMFGIRKRRPPPFGGVHVDDDKDIQEHKPEEASRNDLWSEARLLLRDLAFALMIAVLVVVFIVQPVKVEGTSMLPRCTTANVSSSTS